MQAKIDNLKNQAEVFLEQGEREKARACYKKMLALGRWRREVSPRDLFEAQIKLGEIYAYQRKYLKSTRAFSHALGIAEGKIGLISPETATALKKLALIYRMRGEIQASREVMYTSPSFGREVGYYLEGAYQRSWERSQSVNYGEQGLVIEELLQEPSAYPDHIAVLFGRSRFHRQDGHFYKA